MQARSRSWTSQEIADHVSANGCPFRIIEDRGEAIRSAMRDADSNTVISLTGKGRERDRSAVSGTWTLRPTWNMFRKSSDSNTDIDWTIRKRMKSR
ncbi:MAG: hypothetical protein V8R14_02995 [Clostridia bacterium]